MFKILTGCVRLCTAYTVKKGLAVFPSLAGMSITKLSLAGNDLPNHSPKKVWSKQIQESNKKIYRVPCPHFHVETFMPITFSVSEADTAQLSTYIALPSNPFYVYFHTVNLKPRSNYQMWLMVCLFTTLYQGAKMQTLALYFK